MAIFRYEWCRVEGNLVPDLGKEYGTLTQLPSDTKVFYGTPSIQIDNPTSVINGCIYKVVPISEFGYLSIKDIDGDYNNLLKQIKDYNKSTSTLEGAQYYFEPFVVTESSVIFHADSTKKSFDHYAIVYVDAFATPEMITVAANYIGQPIPVGETFDTKNIEIYAVYSDGNRVLIKEGYTLEPADKKITQLGSNSIKITYVSPTDVTFVTSIIIEGTKRLEAIEALYDGPSIAYDNEAPRKYFVVVAKYSDGSSATIADFSFPNGNVVNANNSGAITIFYKGLYTTVVVPTYEVSASRLIAYYNGPNVEVGQDFNPSYCKIKIYYQSSDSVNTYYEDIDPAICVFSITTIEHEGVNHVTVQYTGKLGVVSTTMIVVGINPEAVLSFIEAEYTGAPVPQGKAFSIERVICKAHYTNGAIVVVKNFAINSNVIQHTGLNEYIATYQENGKEVITTFGVPGLENDATTGSGYSPIALQNNYPEATRLNNRYRGPAEGYKHNSVQYMLWENICNLYKLFASIEQDFNAYVESAHGSHDIRVKTLNTISQINAETTSWVTDSRFTTGKYQAKKEESHE